MKHTTKFLRQVTFKDLSGRRRHAKAIRTHTVERNFASGGAVASDTDPWSSAKPAKKAPKKRAYGGRSVGKHSGSLTVKRLDKVARGVQKRQAGGPVGRPALPVQAAPAATAAPAAAPARTVGGAPAAGPAVNPAAWATAPGLQRFGGMPPGLGGTMPARPISAPGVPAALGGRPAWAGTGLPPQAAQAALQALAARRGLPATAMGVRPFKRGGAVPTATNPYSMAHKK
jgi:hypothetical protein